MGRPTKYNKDMLPVLIDCGKQGMGVVEMSVAIGICRDTFNEWRKDNKEFSDTVNKALAYSQAWWERLGREGSTGEKQINPTTWIFNMKNRFRDDWRDKQEVEQSGVTVVKLKQEF
jgi:transposase